MPLPSHKKPEDNDTQDQNPRQEPQFLHVPSPALRRQYLITCTCNGVPAEVPDVAHDRSRGIGPRRLTRDQRRNVDPSDQSPNLSSAATVSARDRLAICWTRAFFGCRSSSCR